MATLTIGRVRDVDIKVNWSVGIIGTLIVASLATDVLPGVDDSASTASYWFAAIIATIVFYACLIGHELGHVAAAQREGVTMESITLWLFGGVAQTRSSPRTPRAAARIAGAGPLVSFGLGIAFFAASLPFGGIVSATLLWLGAMNTALAIFNLLPAFPMDGGRLLQAWRWNRTGDELAATDQAAWIGGIIGALLVAAGAMQALFGAFVYGLWLMMIGIFIREAAKGELTGSLLDHALRATPVARIMAANPSTVDASTSLHEFAMMLLASRAHAAYPVVDNRGREMGDGGKVIGFVAAGALRQVPRDDWGDLVVGDICTDLDGVTTVSPEMSLAELLERLGTDENHRALVLDGSHLVGVVAPSDVTRFVSTLQTLGIGKDGSVIDVDQRLPSVDDEHAL